LFFTAGFLFGLLLDPEDGGEFLNIERSLIYTVLQPTTPYYSRCTEVVEILLFPEWL
jgi:hypothetical protein